MAGALLLAALAGYGFGRWSAARDLRAPIEASRAARDLALASVARPATADARAVPEADPADVDPSEAVARALRWSDDPAGLVASVVEDMTRDELALALATLTGRDREELERQRDLHGYARSMARAAMSGILTERDATPAEAIEFGEMLSEVSGDEPGREQLGSGATRIYGVFPLETAEEARVVAKWYRVDEPELMTFEELPVRGRDGEGFVRFDRPGGWPEGDYRLELFDPHADHRLIAAGSYRVRGGRGPLKVVFQ